jgi:hypothetical protein
VVPSIVVRKAVKNKENQYHQSHENETQQHQKKKHKTGEKLLGTP